MKDCTPSKCHGQLLSGCQNMREYLPHSADLEGKTIQEFVCDASNVWHLKFDDGTYISILIQEGGNIPTMRMISGFKDNVVYSTTVFKKDDAFGFKGKIIVSESKSKEKPTSTVDIPLSFVGGTVKFHGIPGGSMKVTGNHLADVSVKVNNWMVTATRQTDQEIQFVGPERTAGDYVISLFNTKYQRLVSVVYQ